jgi:hypothetical protein
MGIDSLFSKSIFDKYKHIDLVCNTKEEWAKGHEDFNSMHDAAKKEGYKGICVNYTGPYIAEMIRKINEEMLVVRRDYKRKSAASERAAANIIINT